MSRGDLFGSVAHAYDQYRPSYPKEAVRWIAARAGGPKACEIGAGTGKATELFLARGLHVTAVEPDREMAAVGERRAPAAEWTIASADTWDLAGKPFDLLYGAQSWHWVPEASDRRLVSAVGRGGLIAWMWNFPNFEKRAALLDDIYRRHMTGKEIAAMEARRRTSRNEANWVARMRQVAEAVTVEWWEWSVTMSTAEYAGLTGTRSDHLAMAEGRRRRLLEDVANRLDEQDGQIRVEYATVVVAGVAP